MITHLVIVLVESQEFSRINNLVSSLRSKLVNNIKKINVLLL